MSAQFYTATLTAAGTPQKLISSLTPALPVLSALNQTFPAGSATLRAFHLKLQAWPANTGTNIYIGGPAMNKATPSGVGVVLQKTAQPTDLGQCDSNIALEDIWFDGDTTGDKLLVVLVG